MVTCATYRSRCSVRSTSFTPEQRRLFLKFIWGRVRLPLTEEDWGEQRMRIHTLEMPRPIQVPL